MRWGSLNTLQTLTLIWLGAGPGSQARCVEPLYGDIQLEDSITRVLSPGVTNTLDLFPPKHQILGWQQHVPLTHCHMSHQSNSAAFYNHRMISECMFAAPRPRVTECSCHEVGSGPEIPRPGPSHGDISPSELEMKVPGDFTTTDFSLLKVPNNLLAISTFTKNPWRHYAYYGSA